ncbi:MAG: hypothetical protein AAF399_08240 [Bacteroidota bacterium]
MKQYLLLLCLTLASGAFLPALFSQSSLRPTPEQDRLPPQVEIQVGYDYWAQRMVPEIRNLNRRGNVALLLRPGRRPGLRWGVFYQYQERSGSFNFYRLLPDWGGMLQSESYPITSTQHSTGLQAAVRLNGAIASIFHRELPNWIELYQNYFVSVTWLSTFLPPEVNRDDITTGFSSQLGVSDFPNTGEDMRYGFGTMLGTRLHIPHTPLSLFGEFGIGPLQAVNVGGVLRL